MKGLTHLVAMLGIFSLASVFSGCGEDDDGDVVQQSGGNLPPEEEPQFGPGWTYTATVAGQTDAVHLTFPAPGTYKIIQSATTETGTSSGATRVDRTWTFNLTPHAGQEGAKSGVLRLDFTSTYEGVWTFTPEGGAPETGSFVAAFVDPDGGDTGGPNPYEDAIILLLQGRTLVLNYKNGGAEKFEFVTESEVLYESVETGTYTWDPANRSIHVALNNGWLYEIRIPAGSSMGTVTFRGAAESETEIAAYTLSP